MFKRLRVAMTAVAIGVMSTFVLTGCTMEDFTELFMGRSAERAAEVSGDNSTDSGTVADVATGDAVQIEDYDATELVELVEYKGVEMDCTVSDEEIQDEIDMLLDDHPLQVKKGTAEDGMTVNIDYSGKLNGKKFDGGTAKGTTITLGDSGMIPGFDDGIIGMKVGEKKDVELTFPDEYPNNPDLAGKKTVFTMKLNYIEEKPDFTDEFVQSNTEYKTTTEFKEAKRKELGDSKEENAKSSGALEKVVTDSKVLSVPETLIQAEKEMLRAQTENQMKMYGMTIEDALTQQGMTMDDFEQYLEGNAKNMAESELIMEAIAIKENIDTSPEAVNAYIEEMLEKSASNAEDGQEPMTMDQLKENYANVYGTSMPFERYMRSSMIYTKVADLVGENAKIIR